MVIMRLLSSRSGEPDDMQRQIMVIPHTFSPSRHDRVRWHVETNYGHSAPFVIQRRRARWHAKTNYGHSVHLFTIQTRSCPMARRDKLWSFCAFCHPNTIMSDGTRRQIMVILHLFPSRYNRVRWHVETNYGHSEPFVIQRRRARWHAEIPYGHPRLSLIERNEFGSIRMMLVIRYWSFSKFLQVLLAGRLTGRMVFRSNEISVLSLLPFYLQ